jgi:predicted lipoprotein with Yx(FWY)xxD motif
MAIRYCAQTLSNRRVYSAALTIVAVALLLTGGASSAAVSPRAGAPTKHVVAARHNALLEGKALTTVKGLTLYSLSIERHGKFACTGTCVSLWHPLLIGGGTKPTGPVKLDTIKRPDGGKTQVAYRGMPLYTYGGDSVPGQANGNGITDVGRWHAATVPSSG